LEELDAINTTAIPDEHRVALPDRFVAAKGNVLASFLKHVDGAPRPRGILFYWAMASKIVANPLPWLIHQARAELHEHGVGDDAFVVAHIRHGHKYIEQKLVAEASFQQALVRMCACFNTRHILIVTEDPNSVALMTTWGKANQYNIFATDYSRQNADVWNLKMQKAGKAPAISAAGMDVEGYMAVLNLVMSRQAVALVGTMQSSWAKLTAAMMYAYHGRPVPILGLAANGVGHTLYGTLDAAFYVEGVETPFTWTCLSNTTS
jgi:hypothetical protein